MAICIIHTEITAMTMVPSNWPERATHDGRHTSENGQASGNAEVPEYSRAAAVAIILWSCVAISLAWPIFLVLLIRMR